MMVTIKVLLYIQSVRNYFNQNPEVKNYFVGKSDEELFFHELGEVSQKNVDDDKGPTLTKEQFEELRTVKINSVKYKNIFIDLGEYGQIGLN